MKNLAICVSLVLLIMATPLLAGDHITVHKEKKYAEPTATTAAVYVVRPAFMGKAVKMWAFVDDEPIGANKGQQYTFALVPPGNHTFWALSENVSAIQLEVEAGKTYYLKQVVKMGGMKARVRLVELGEEEGREAIGKCKYTELTEEGRERGKEIVANKYDTALKKAEGGR